MERASLIILSYNKLAFTKKCLESLLETQYPDMEILVVDNGSKEDGIMEYLVNFQNRCLEKGIKFRFLVQGENLGCATSRNAAMRLSTGNYLVFLDNDVYIDDSLWLTKLVDFYKTTTNIGVVSIKMLYPQHPNIIQSLGGVVSTEGKVGYWGRGENDSEYPTETVTDVQYYGAACLFMEKKMISEVGYLDERFDPMGFAAIDYSYRIREKGYRIVNYSGVSMYHYENTTTMHTHELNFKYYYAKHSVMFKKKWSHVYEKENVLTNAEVEKLWEFKPKFVLPD